MNNPEKATILFRGTSKGKYLSFEHKITISSVTLASTRFLETHIFHLGGISLHERVMNIMVVRFSAICFIRRLAAIFLLSIYTQSEAGYKISGICIQTHTAVQELNQTAQFELRVKSEQEYQLDVTTDDGRVIYGEFEGTHYWFRRLPFEEINLLKAIPSTVLTNLIADDHLVEAIAIAVAPRSAADPVSVLKSSDIFVRDFLASTTARSITSAGSAVREIEIIGVFPDGQSNVIGHFNAPRLPLLERSSATLKRYDPNRTTPPKDRTLTTYQVSIEKVENGVPVSLFQQTLSGVTRVIDRRGRTAENAQVPTFYNITNSPWPLKGTVVFQKRVMQPNEASKGARIALFAILFASTAALVFGYIKYKQTNKQ